ncbi:TetR/AcrR family transcriptional regulator [Vibrio sp. 99-70-13A1]|uniref:TetR/AcrR family transcriptional regulator n=1 Tax=Vibrio sp. 99-70-13A1 TaxID=2607601 RepID=UPI0014932FC4|nr:TetR/AcrR family transcriptional regulator [Vibrio sp. 99-70-13A1]NOH96018.1 TetR/AcrR family transcriptional regulator [Vibrio sp. 99-70-13A1]
MSKGKITKEYILSCAFELASENGLESLTIGELAKKCGMSKSGLFAHFNSKENLQVSVLEYSNTIFTQRVIAPARELGDADIEAKLKQLLENWLGWNHSFQGSCMFIDAWKDASSESSPIQKALQDTIAVWIKYLTIQISKAIESKQFRADLDAKQATFELYGLYLSANLFYSLQGQQASHRHFWQGVERLVTSWK